MTCTIYNTVTGQRERYNSLVEVESPLHRRTFINMIREEVDSIAVGKLQYAVRETAQVCDNDYVN